MIDFNFKKLKQLLLQDLLTRYFVAGKEIFSFAWCKFFSISHCTLQRMQSKLTVEDGIQPGNSGSKRLNTKTEGAVAWMERYFNLIADNMLDKDQMHLPCWETQKEFYYRYLLQMSIYVTNSKFML